MDTVGYGVVLASHRYTVQDVVALFKGEAEPLRSRFTLNFNMVANLVHNYEEAQARRIVEQCFSQFQNNATILQLHALQEQAKGKVSALDPACPRFPEEHVRADLLEAYKGLKKSKEDRRTTVVNMEAGRSHLKREDAARAIKAAPFHSWLIVQVPNADHAELGILLDKYPVKSGDVQYTVLLEDNTLTRLSLRHLILPLNAPVKGVPGDIAKRADKLSYQQSERMRDRQLPWDQWLDQCGIVPEDVIPDMADPPALVKAKETYADAVADWEAHQCFNCRLYRKCQDEHKDFTRQMKEQRYYQDQIEAIRGKYWRQFQTLQGVLEDAYFLRGRELLPRGVALANLRTNNELLASEVFASGLLGGLDPIALCAVTSAIVAEPIRGRMNWHPLRVSERVFRSVDEVSALAGDLFKILKRHDVHEETPLYVTGDYVGMVQAWAEGAEWAHVIELSGVDEGQLVRHLRQLIDMLRQFKDVPGNSEAFRERCMEALALVDRDIVREVF
jgi:superfamily II RNA helicase